MTINEGSQVITTSFKYTESIRQRIEREAIERMTKIYNNRKSKLCHNDSIGLNNRVVILSEEDVYGQIHTK